MSRSSVSLLHLRAPRRVPLQAVVTWDQFTALHASSTSTSSSAGWSPELLESRLREGPPTWEDGTGPIPDQVVRRIACDSDITRIVFGPDSQILNIGRTRRTFTKEHRRAIVDRDRQCVWPGCDAPPHVCEVHHAVRHWAEGGETTPSNGALLCRFHHHRGDGEDIAMAYADGWTFNHPGTHQPSDAA